MNGPVLFTRPIPGIGPRLISEVADSVIVPDRDEPLSPEALIEQVRRVDPVVVVSMLHDKVDVAMFDAAPRCRQFSNFGVGYNNIDVAEATRRGVAITNTPGVLSEATADLTWALILAVARGVIDGDRTMRAGEFTGWGPSYQLGTEVTGKTLGIVGPGRIAFAVAERARGFRMPILYHGRKPRAEWDAIGAKLVPLDALLRDSDFVSIHAPLTAETRHMIDARALGLMKPSSYLINTSRGPVVDEEALVGALQEGRIAGAGLDVYEKEPLMAAGLAGCPNAVLLPHLGSATVETRDEMSKLTAANVIAALKGECPPSLVNPEVRQGA